MNNVDKDKVCSAQHVQTKYTSSVLPPNSSMKRIAQGALESISGGKGDSSLEVFAKWTKGF